MYLPYWVLNIFQSFEDIGYSRGWVYLVFCYRMDWTKSMAVWSCFFVPVEETKGASLLYPVGAFAVPVDNAQIWMRVIGIHMLTTAVVL